MVEAVSVEGLVKRFGSFTAVDAVSFGVEAGEIFGILGPNGAGKTTTLEIIEGLQKPTQGRVTVLGMDILKEPQRIKARMGVQLQSSSYFDYLTLRELLTLMGSFFGKKVKPDGLLEQVGLLDKAKSRVNQLSGGQKQRFTVAASLVNDPELLVLDEPTIGLDPQSRRHLWELIRQVHERGVTVMLTTHYMDEAQILCHRLAIMDRGKLVAVDTPQHLIGRLQATYSVKLVLAQPLSETQLASLNGGPGAPKVQTLEENTYILRLDNSPGALDKVLDTIVRGNISLQHMEVTPVTLEDVFLELTGQELRD
ncbi:MAG: ABC transporter ATP-binding protein [Dehalococcoidia bacterium]|nr:ABC transporter ATP-binding protein [Dehalococcoidia bacterium]MSQ16428.1 ABC transporter ATP-binding protein [Dehalococcoidia bacterium]